MKKLLLMSALLLLVPTTAFADEETVVSSTASSELSTEVGATESTFNSSEKAESMGVATSQSATNDSSQVSSSSDENIDVSSEVVDVIATIEDSIDKADEQSVLTDNLDPNSIRKMLADPEYSQLISAEELASYTDKQLTNAMTLTIRMGTDVYGLDIGGYVRILQALYQSNTLSWEKIEPQLAFNPANYSNAIDMIANVDQLQAYLAALYPSNSSVIAIKQLSNDELVNILTYISPIQKKMIEEEGSLFPGIIGWIMNYSTNEDVLAGSNIVPVPEKSTGSTTSSESTSTTDSAKKTDKDKTGFLPQTGEQIRSWLSVLGAIIIVVVLIFIVGKNKKKNNSR